VVASNQETQKPGPDSNKETTPSDDDKLSAGTTEATTETTKEPKEFSPAGETSDS